MDLTIATGFGGEEPVIAGTLDRLHSRVDDPAGFARANRVLLLRAAGIDAAEPDVGVLLGWLRGAAHPLGVQGRQLGGPRDEVPRWTPAPLRPTPVRGRRADRT